MRALAAEIGMSPMAAYQYFKNLEALRVELWRVIMTDLDARATQAATVEANPRDAWLALGCGVIRYAWESPRRFEFVFHDPIVDAVRTVDELTPLRLGLVVRSRRYLEQAIERGDIRKDLSTDEIVLSSLATVQGYGELVASQRTSAVFAMPLDQVITMARRWLLDAVAPR